MGYGVSNLSRGPSLYVDPSLARVVHEFCLTVQRGTPKKCFFTGNKPWSIALPGVSSPWVSIMFLDSRLGPSTIFESWVWRAPRHAEKQSSNQSYGSTIPRRWEVAKGSGWCFARLLCLDMWSIGAPCTFTYFYLGNYRQNEVPRTDSGHFEW